MRRAHHFQAHIAAPQMLPVAAVLHFSRLAVRTLVINGWQVILNFGRWFWHLRRSSSISCFHIFMRRFNTVQFRRLMVQVHKASVCNVLHTFYSLHSNTMRYRGWVESCIFPAIWSWWAHSQPMHQP